MTSNPSLERRPREAGGLPRGSPQLERSRRQKTPRRRGLLFLKPEHMSFTFEPWLAAARALGGALTFFAGLEEKRRGKAAGYLDEIATTLDSMATAANEGKKVGRHCIALGT